MTDRNEREIIARGERAKRAIEEFVGPEFAFARQRYLDRIAEVAAQELNPKTREEKITTLAVAIRVLDEVKNGISLVMHEGERARSHALAVEQLEKLTDTQRRLIAVTG